MIHTVCVGSFTINRSLSQNINIVRLVCIENKEKYFILTQDWLLKISWFCDTKFLKDFLIRISPTNTFDGLKLQVIVSSCLFVHFGVSGFSVAKELCLSLYWH